MDGINKIVIVADMKDVARVFIRKAILTDEVEQIVGAVKVQACRKLEVNEHTLEVEAS